jgi:hypothetical protein
MVTAKGRSKSKRLTLNITVVFMALLFFVFLGPGLFNIDVSWAWGDHGERTNFCSQTAWVAFLACQNEVTDDFWIATGNCINVSEEEDREECFQDARADNRDAKEECKDQYWARRDLCEDLGEDRYDPDLEEVSWVSPAAINASTANPYFPLVRGNMWTYKTRVGGGSPTETITVEVLDETITIQGVECVVVHDIVYEGNTTDSDAIIEDTYDWYGQDTDGNVWYFGEFSLAKEDCDPEELCEGLFTEDGSWKSGYNGGKAGIIMFGDPEAEVETVYRQELSLGNAEDAGKVLRFGEDSVTITLNGSDTTFDDDVVVTLDFTPIDPAATENKYHVPGVGTVLEVGFEDGDPTGERVELESINFTPSL